MQVWKKERRVKKRNKKEYKKLGTDQSKATLALCRNVAPRRHMEDVKVHIRRF